MRVSFIMIVVSFVVICVFAAFVALLILALVKYIKAKDNRCEKAIMRKSLGEAIKEHRTHCKMTQEFVAEALGVSRQAVSKWENGTSDPSTGNLIALAKLFGISAEELLTAVQT